MILEQIFFDHSDNAAINTRILTAPTLFTKELTLTDTQKSEFFNALILQAKKLLAIWIHYDRFLKEEQRLEKNAPIFEEAAPQGHIEIQYSQELYLEFDEYLVQYKSSLDYLAKLPAPLLGYKVWNPSTFGDKGRRIVKMLHSALPKEKKNHATGFEKIIFEKHKKDIEIIVEARDKINHFLKGGIPFKNFTVYGIKNGDDTSYRFPMWSPDQRMSDFMRVAFYNHLRFCEDYIIFFLGLYLKKGFGFFHHPLPADSAASPYELIHESLLPMYVAKYSAEEMRSRTGRCS